MFFLGLDDICLVGVVVSLVGFGASGVGVGGVGNVIVVALECHLCY